MFERPSLADFALLPFIRQFAFIDKHAFDALGLPGLQKWLDRFLYSDAFAQIMTKCKKWEPGEEAPVFP